MSSTVLSHALVCASFAFLGTNMLAEERQQTLSCETAKDEDVALKQAPMGARRVGTHVLEVTSRKGPQRFVDKPPHDEGGMAGVHWRYCGYDSRAKAHLIEMSDAGLFSGKLLLNETGKRVHAGHTVFFSPSGKSFLAVEQESGMDGQKWSVYDAGGKKVWEGYAGKTANVDGIETVVSTFESPRWTKQGELIAGYVCTASAHRGVVNLVRSSSGDWRWHGGGNCS